MNKKKNKIMPREIQDDEHESTRKCSHSRKTKINK